MSEEYGNMPYAIEYARDKQRGTKTLKKLAFRDGANAALKEVEEVILHLQMESKEEETPKEISSILTKIRELRG